MKIPKIIEIMAKLKDGMTITEINAITNSTLSTTAPLIHKLNDKGFLFLKNQNKRSYFITLSSLGVIEQKYCEQVYYFLKKFEEK